MVEQHERETAVAAYPSLHAALAHATKQYLLEVMQLAQGSPRRAARIAGISRGHFHKLLAKHAGSRRKPAAGNAEWQALGAKHGP